jgi:Domain of unknown function (DUF4249)
MQLKRIIVIVVAFSIVCFACIKQVNVKTRNEKPILVVDGAITTDTTPYTVRLSYTGPFVTNSQIQDENFEKDAQVSISDDQGNTTKLVYIGEGVYETTDPSYIGKTGRSYHVIVALKDGKKYISAPEKISPPVPFTNINVKFVPDFNLDHPAYLGTYVDVKDPADQENYYRWSFYSWIMRQTHGIPCGNLCIIYEYCFQKIADNEIRIFSDAAVNGNQILNQFMGRSYIYAFGNQYVDMRQLSISRANYQFLLKLQEQQTRTGGVLDPLPASVKGNVYNEADPNDFTLGYFSASASTHKRVTVVPFGITRYLLDISAVSFIPEGSKNCFIYFPNALSYPPPPAEQYPPPPGWEHADTIKVNW